MVARPWSSSRLSCGERLLLRCDGNARNSFPATQGKDHFSRAMWWKRGSSGCGRDSRASSRVETGMSGTFLSCSNGATSLAVSRAKHLPIPAPASHHHPLAVSRAKHHQYRPQPLIIIRWRYRERSITNTGPSLSITTIIFIYAHRS